MLSGRSPLATARSACSLLMGAAAPTTASSMPLSTSTLRSKARSVSVDGRSANEPGGDGEAVRVQHLSFPAIIDDDDDPSPPTLRSLYMFDETGAGVAASER